MTKELVKKRTFEEIENKLAKISATYQFEILHPLMEVTLKDIPRYVEDKINGAEQLDMVQPHLEMGISDFNKFFGYIIRVIRNFEKGVR